MKSRPDLGGAMEVALEAMVSTKCTKAAARLVVEGLLAHFFSADLPQYVLEDVRWFFELINKQQRCWLMQDENIEPDHSSQINYLENVSFEENGYEESEVVEKELEACDVHSKPHNRLIEGEERKSEEYSTLKAQVQVKGYTILRISF
jgi:hypothetical protein